MKRALAVLVVLLLSLGLRDAPALTGGTEKSPQTPNLGPGDYVWQPQAAPDGPVVIVIDLAGQYLQVFRNGTLIGRSTVSSGRETHETPTGIFTILQKKTTHHSTVYHEASMPFMERLTWGGVAIHAGSVPGHPDSHGCVHVPMEFAKKLYTVTSKGCTVLIAPGNGGSAPPAKPDLEFSTTKGTVAAPPTGPEFRWHPEASSGGPLCIVYSTADGQVYAYRGGMEIGAARVQGNPTSPVGNRVYAALAQTNPEGFHDWNLLGSLDSSPAPNATDLLRQLAIPDAFRQDLKQTVTPGTTLVVTDESVDKESARQNGNDILDSAGG